MKILKFYGNQFVGSLKQRFVQYLKKYLIVSAKVCAIAWLFTGGIFLGKNHTQPVYADREVIKEVSREAPVLARIAKCESGNKHLGPNGQVIINANNNGSVDIGVMQINERIWGAEATKQGLNLWVEKDNRAFAEYLYANFGTEPWVWSKQCWNK